VRATNHSEVFFYYGGMHPIARTTKVVSKPSSAFWNCLDSPSTFATFAAYSPQIYFQNI
jgi:hypothetical protein